MKKSGKIIKVIVILVLIAGAAYGGYRIYENKTMARATAESAPSYSAIAVQTGAITQTAISTGLLSIAETADVTAPIDLTVKSVDVQTNQTLSLGTPLITLDSDALETTISSLKAQIEEQDSAIVSLANKEVTVKTLTSPIAGRVKAIYVSAGQNLQEALDENEALMLFSLDGLMKVDIPVNGVLQINAEVKVVSDGRTYTGTVTRISADKATVVFSDIRTEIGEEVQVLFSDLTVGTGKAEVNMPFLFTTSIDGFISSISVKLNASVSKGTSLMYIINMVPTDVYLAALEARAELQAKLETAKELYKNPVLSSGTDGIVSAINIAAGNAVMADTPLMTLFIGGNMKMDISVDELDIINVTEGQSADVIMDALPETELPAKVEFVSQIGATSSGITTYSVTLALEGGEALKPGMNGTATIYIGEVSDTVLVPLVALQSDKKGSYVWLASENYTATEDAPGVKTYITTGLSNEDYAAVTSGLKAGDSVLVVRSTSLASAENNTPTGLQTLTIPGGEGITPPQDRQRPGDGSGSPGNRNGN